MKTWSAVTLATLDEVARAIIQQAENCRVIVFHGEMGAGKTTFIKSICKQLGVVDAVSSPTFSIVNEYHTTASHKVFHFDFYRIKNEQEAYDIGTEEYFYSGHYCLLEWPERIPSLLPDDYAIVHIDPENETARTIAFSIHARQEEKRL